MAGDRHNHTLWERVGVEAVAGIVKDEAILLLSPMHNAGVAACLLE